MLDVLVAAAVVALVVALGLAVLYAVTVVPFTLAVTVAERRGYGTARWGTLAALGSAAALLAALLARHRGPVVVGLVLLLAFAVPVVAPLGRAAGSLAGRRGEHQ